MLRKQPTKSAGSSESIYMLRITLCVCVCVCVHSCSASSYQARNYSLHVAVCTLVLLNIAPLRSQAIL